MSQSNPKIAIVHDFLQTLGGAERVLLAISEIYPDAPIYTLTYDKKLDSHFGNKKIVTSYLQKWSWLPTKFLLPFYPLAIESFNFDNFNIVISNSHSFSKNILTKPETIHISYVNSPMRYVWDAWHSYLAGQKLFWPAKGIVINILHKLRIWDRLGVSRVDYFVANSKHVQKRIQKYYRRDSRVIYPPVDTDKITVSHERKNYFLALSRLSQYKRIDLAVQACKELNLQLVVIGSGEAEADLKKLGNENITFVGWMDDSRKFEYIRNARALIFPGEEDFGIVPVEAMSAGKPVIAYGKGGLLETVVEGKTGLFFNEPTVESLKQAIQNFISREGEGNNSTIQQFNNRDRKGGG